MGILEYIYEGVVDNFSGHSRKMRREAVSSTTYFKISESVQKRRKRYAYHPKDRYKLTCLIHGPVHSSDEYKVLGDFGYKYCKIRSTKDRRKDPAKNN